jgi:hypothetical protein
MVSSRIIITIFIFHIINVFGNNYENILNCFCNLDDTINNYNISKLSCRKIDINMIPDIKNDSVKMFLKNQCIEHVSKLYETRDLEKCFCRPGGYQENIPECKGFGGFDNSNVLKYLGNICNKKNIHIFFFNN